jgi:hypothetical protein
MVRALRAILGLRNLGCVFSKVHMGLAGAVLPGGEICCLFCLVMGKLDGRG